MRSVSNTVVKMWNGILVILKKGLVTVRFGQCSFFAFRDKKLKNRESPILYELFDRDLLRSIQSLSYKSLDLPELDLNQNLTSTWVLKNFLEVDVEAD